MTKRKTLLKLIGGVFTPKSTKESFKVVGKGIKGAFEAAEKRGEEFDKWRYEPRTPEERKWREDILKSNKKTLEELKKRGK